MILLLACNVDVYEGTIVGNPGDAMVASAAPKNLDVVEGTLSFDEWVLTPCSGEEIEGVAGDDIALSEDVLDVPGGQWCGVVLADAVLEMSATDGEHDVDVVLEIDAIDLGSTEVLVDGGTYVIELAEPDWLDLTADGDVVIDEEHEDHDTLADLVAATSGVFVDDGDGELSEAERDAGPATAGPDRDVPEQDTGDTGSGEGADAGTGCAVAPVGGFWLLGLLLVGRRRVGEPRSVAGSQRSIRRLEGSEARL